MCIRDRQTPLSESVIKQIHYLVLADKKDDRGVYRRVPVRIMGSKHGPVQSYLCLLYTSLPTGKEDGFARAMPRREPAQAM